MFFFRKSIRPVPTLLIAIADVLLGCLLILAAVHFSRGAIPYLGSLAGTPANSKEYIEKAKEIFNLCASGNTYACYTSKLAELTKREGFTTGTRTLKALQDMDDLAKNCHVPAHFMAREALKREPDKWEGLLDRIDVNACGSGYLHGILEAYLGGNSNTIFDARLANRICSRWPAEPYRERMCFHFMGHFFLVDTNGALRDALPRCEAISAEFIRECYIGAFMEDHQKLALTEHGIAPSPKVTEAYIQKLEQDCGTYTGQKADACWEEMGEMYAKLYGYDPQKVYAGCMHAGADVYAQSCYAKGVVAIAVYINYATAEKLLGLCRFYEKDPSLYKTCTGTIITALMFYSPKFIDRGAVLCANVESSLKEWCFTELGTQLEKVVASPAERISLCEAAPPTYRQHCAGS